MVERPIKKSERPAQPVASESTPRAKPLEDSGHGRPTQGRDKGKGRGKKDAYDDEPRQAKNPALMRGPKPSKFVAPVGEEAVLSEASEDVSTADMASDETSMTADVLIEATTAIVTEG
ncbi:hypothetical protein [Neosynechococcus sphagnicola]|uniref:hypothetical protein n=1 Tax=Neosynechococcus sphagnicola TaxID=1501145 RepID=UPI000689A420|nr:hypothetical protein [Neosynechococcus sphagnicola]